MDVSREKVKEILEKHKPTPLQKDTQTKIQEILKRAQKDLA
jgi:trimethylamine:corrinoid methyltransferase-like protein